MTPNASTTPSPDFSISGRPGTLSGRVLPLPRLVLIALSCRRSRLRHGGWLHVLVLLVRRSRQGKPWRCFQAARRGFDDVLQLGLLLVCEGDPQLGEDLTIGLRLHLVWVVTRVFTRERRRSDGLLGLLDLLLGLRQFLYDRLELFQLKAKRFFCRGNRCLEVDATFCQGFEAGPRSGQHVGRGHNLLLLRWRRCGFRRFQSVLDLLGQPLLVGFQCEQ